ncbi:MAG TPA: nucleotidyltransferase family protein [Candidatus Binatia bacterium]|nr:nucleotidyltransferase family protein [Candidatus Binatia bacterium]
MSRDRSGRARPLLLQALAEPERLPSLSAAGWDRLLREARRAEMLGRIAALVAGLGALDRIPTPARDPLEAARLIVEQQQRLIRWEITRILHALAGSDFPIVLLKGAAYLLAELPAGRGRLFADVDIMVPAEQLVQVEERLLQAGWEFVTLDRYDERYYRSWSHELMPMRHRHRGIVVDVHHNILPPVGRLLADARLLLEAARPLPGSRLAVLAPPDMILHSAVHMFQSGELHSALRDLTDLDALLRHFARDPGFFDALVARAHALGLARPLFYALRNTRRLLGTPTPEGLERRVDIPPRPVRALMDYLVSRAMVPRLPDATPRGVTLSRWALHVRYQWQRMPARLLARHLLHKALSRRAAR